MKRAPVESPGDNDPSVCGPSVTNSPPSIFIKNLQRLVPIHDVLTEYILPLLKYIVLPERLGLHTTPPCGPPRTVTLTSPLVSHENVTDPPWACSKPKKIITNNIGTIINLKLIFIALLLSG